MDFVKSLNLLSLILLIVGGLNWGLVGLFQFDLVAAVFGGPQASFSRLIYLLVSVSAIWQLIPFYRSITSSNDAVERGQ